MMGSYSSLCLKRVTGQLVCPIHSVLNVAKAAVQSRDNQETHLQTEAGLGCDGSETTLMLFAFVIGPIWKKHYKFKK